jgi:hypothetical protein
MIDNPVFQKIDNAHVHIPSKKGRPELYYKVDGHWNEAGHAFVAAQILKELQIARKLNP